jgi:hypothetical protein
MDILIVFFYFKSFHFFHINVFQIFFFAFCINIFENCLDAIYILLYIYIINLYVKYKYNSKLSRNEKEF